ncbi:MAG: hypothetical protein HY731_11220, partial [Candidatus Tectomicrobia bacterium]|nr:hypothetical protein [Candidatus Tectomicrobia bacterium]
LQFHTKAQEYGAQGQGRRGAMLHGHGVGTDDAKVNLLRYFRQIDSGLQQEIFTEGLNAKELHEQARAIVEPRFQQALKESEQVAHHIRSFEEAFFPVIHNWSFKVGESGSI